MIGENFNIDEVFEIAEQIERNGYRFYTLAAESVDFQEHKSFLNEMASMEEAHEEYFAWLRKKFREYDNNESCMEDDSEAALYLQAIAEMLVFDLEQDPADKVTGKSFEEILKQAVVAEKDTVLFYLGLKKAMLDQVEQKKIDSIIDEEMSHVRILSRRLHALKKA